MTTDRDPTIGTLLDQLERPPAAGPAFWDDLRERLEHGRRVVELRPVPPGGPRRDRTVVLRRRVVAAVAAAAVVATGVYGITRAVGHDDAQVHVPATAPPTTGTTVSPTVALVRSTATTWIDDVVRGRADAAWALVGPQSRQMVDRSAFTGMLSDLQATWAPWASEAEVHALPIGSASADWWVVTLRSPAGEPQALVVHRTGPSVAVEPFIPGTAVSLVSFPSSQGTPAVGPGSTIPLHVDADAARSLVAVDGVAVPPASLHRDGAGAVVGVTAPSEPGRHDVVVAELTRDGTVAMVDQGFTVVTG
jgi:hypothetical protein